MHEKGAEPVAFKAQVRGKRVQKKSEMGVLSEIQNSDPFKLGTERFPQSLEQNLKLTASSRSFLERRAVGPLDSCLTPANMTEVASKLLQSDSLRKNSNLGKINTIKSPGTDVEIGSILETWTIEL